MRKPPPRGTPTLRYLRKYVTPGQSREVLAILGGSNTALRFIAPPNVRADTLLLDYQQDALTQTIQRPVRLPPLRALNCDGATRAFQHEPARAGAPTSRRA